MYQGVIQKSTEPTCNIFGNCSCHIAKQKLICLIGICRAPKYSLKKIKKLKNGKTVEIFA